MSSFIQQKPLPCWRKSSCRVGGVRQSVLQMQATGFICKKKTWSIMRLPSFSQMTAYVFSHSNRREMIVFPLLIEMIQSNDAFFRCLYMPSIEVT
mmetsp:Transcript_9992/g.18169  ORF Transcript_9992/g.18169 Transcript_9992/m.18169 type:complete len:95 (+) Transcript_9992:605-889(+)